MTTSRFNTVRAVFATPSGAFAGLRNERPILLPILLLVVGAAAVALTTFMVPLDTLIANDAGAAVIEGPPAERRARITSGILQPAMIAVLVLSAAAAVIVLLLMFAIVLWIAGNVTRDGVSFHDSVSLVAWASLPTLVTDIVRVASAVVRQWWERDSIALDVVFFGLDRAHSLGFPVPPLVEVWVAALVAIGYRQWFAASISKAAAMGFLALGFHVAARFALGWVV